MIIHHAAVIPADATIHGGVGKIVFAHREGDLELQMTEEQMLLLIYKILGFALTAKPTDWNLCWLRKELDNIYQQFR